MGLLVDPCNIPFLCVYGSCYLGSVLVLQDHKQSERALPGSNSARASKLVLKMLSDLFLEIHNEIPQLTHTA